MATSSRNFAVKLGRALNSPLCCRATTTRLGAGQQQRTLSVAPTQQRTTPAFAEDGQRGGGMAAGRAAGAAGGSSGKEAGKRVRYPMCPRASRGVHSRNREGAGGGRRGGGGGGVGGGTVSGTFFSGGELGAFRVSAPRLDKHTMVVPTLGDSISSGQLVEWVKNVGDDVALDDVVCILETEKISVDIRADQAGVLEEQLASVDDDVKVGAKLFVVEGDASASSTAAAASTGDAAGAGGGASPTPPSEEAAVGHTAASAATAGVGGGGESPTAAVARTPLIQFLGKEGWSKRKAEQTSGGAAADASTPGVLTIDQVVGGAMFGRTAWSEEEMLSVDSGGAEGAPEGSLKAVWQ